jgi:iron complex transport system permease protein
MTEIVRSNRSAAETPARQGSGSPRYPRAALILLALTLPAAVIASLGAGAYPMSFGRSFDILFHLMWPFPWPHHPEFDLNELTVVEIIRPSRVLVATLAGMALAMSGTALQGMMRNPLVGPDLVGVSSGAAFGGVLAITLGFPSAGLIALAFCGGLGAMACTFGLAKLVRIKSDGIPLILAGFFVGAFFFACVGLVQFLDAIRLPVIVYWLLGTFRGADPQKVWMIAVPTLAGSTALMLLRWRINLLSLGDLDAASLGINVSYLRYTVIAVVALMVAAQVSVSGIVGWVGIVVPIAPGCS